MKNLSEQSKEPTYDANTQNQILATLVKDDFSHFCPRDEQIMINLISSSKTSGTKYIDVPNKNMFIDHQLQTCLHNKNIKPRLNEATSFAVHYNGVLASRDAEPSSCLTNVGHH